MDKEEMAQYLIKECEGFEYKSYQRKGDRPTIGYGSTFHIDGSPVQLDETCTEEEALDMLRIHLEDRVYPAVDKLCMDIDVPDRVYAGLSSFCYNEGHAYFDKYNFRPYIEAKNWGDFDTESEEATGLCEKFLRYDVAAGVHLPGLRQRRIKEIKFMLNL